MGTGRQQTQQLRDPWAHSRHRAAGGAWLCPLAGVQHHGTELHPFGISAPGLAFLLIAAELLVQSRSPPPSPNHTKAAGKDLGW